MTDSVPVSSLSCFKVILKGPFPRIMRDIRLGFTFRFCALHDPMTPQLSKVCFIIFNIVFHEKLENTGAGRVGRQGEKGGEEEVKGSQIWVGTLEKQAWVPDETYRGSNSSMHSARTHISVFYTRLAALGGGPMSRPSDAHVAFLSRAPWEPVGIPEWHIPQALSPWCWNSQPLHSYAMTACLPA